MLRIARDRTFLFIKRYSLFALLCGGYADVSEICFHELNMVALAAFAIHPKFASRSCQRFESCHGVRVAFQSLKDAQSERDILPQAILGVFAFPCRPVCRDGTCELFHGLVIVHLHKSA